MKGRQQLDEAVQVRISIDELLRVLARSGWPSSALSIAALATDFAEK